MKIETIERALFAQPYPPQSIAPSQFKENIGEQPKVLGYPLILRERLIDC